MNYGYKKEVALPFTEAIEKVKAELAKEGFGIITEVDVKATLKKKLNVDYGNYVILGACNPSFAYEALQTEKEIGLRLPCNTIIYEDADKTFVAVVLPTVVLGDTDNPVLARIGEMVEEKLKRVIDAVSTDVA